ncbi:uncharacterized protein LOC116295010 [Actinia tenebrosa]|uniref:Uncharacterized protein LOC116295010 n=1 Tax=Actinia tenebrosa TaxID=6105 RepID=A0A6P8I108_ACTTE|nr:uncharacterized protein LOC116295010 [Actinia tenebrosa]
MKKQVQQQDKTLSTQNKEIRDLNWYLRRKGTKERLGEIERDVDHQTLILKHAVDIKSLKQFKTSVDKFEKRTKALSAGVQERKKIIDEIYSRIFLQDGKIVCRNTFTSWQKQANYKIGALDKHYIECRDDELLQRFLLERKDGELDSVVRFKYRCCRFNVKDKWKKAPKKMANQ